MLRLIVFSGVLRRGEERVGQEKEGGERNVT
jgi:hypothetical protein